MKTTLRTTHDYITLKVAAPEGAFNFTWSRNGVKISSSAAFIAAYRPALRAFMKDAEGPKGAHLGEWVAKVRALAETAVGAPALFAAVKELRAANPDAVEPESALQATISRLAAELAELLEQERRLERR